MLIEIHFHLLVFNQALKRQYLEKIKTNNMDETKGGLTSEGWGLIIRHIFWFTGRWAYKWQFTVSVCVLPDYKPQKNFFLFNVFKYYFNYLC